MDSDYEVMPIKYLDCYPNLPVDAPVGHPHIIDTDSIDHEFARSQNMTIADAVVTILFKYMPGALTAFLDLERPHFHYIQAGRVARLDFCIKRDRRAVTVGFLNEREVGGWDVQYRYYIDGEATEHWHSGWCRVSDVFVVTDEKKLLEDASANAFSMLIHEPWSTIDLEQEVEVVCGLSDGREI